MAPDPAHSEPLAQLAQAVEDWPALLASAERHGMGPLVYRHLRAAEVSLPQSTASYLMGLYLRPRHANQVRARVLEQVLRAYHAADIEPLVVKGAALCHWLYPELALRPMSDLDLLVRPGQVERGRQILRELGMSAPLPPSGQVDKSLPTAGLHVDGVWVGIELHDNLFETGFGASMTLDDLTVQPLSFALGTDGVTAHTLGVEDSLWHLGEHLRFHTTVFLPWRLIWVADILGIAERYAAKLDWDHVARRYPRVLSTLGLLEHLRPLAASAREFIPIKAARRTPAGIGADFEGWPRYSWAQQRHKGLVRTLRDTWLPPEWWLRLHYGLDTEEPLWRERWFRHPGEIIGWLQHYWRNRDRSAALRKRHERSRK